MVCVAAFIILCLISVFVAVLSIFRRDLGKKYWTTFKKAWGCVGKKITLQKCETNFKADIKNSILKKVVLKKPKLVKPISVGIEITAVLVVLITAWSLVEGVKAGLSLWTLGTCNVVQPSACVIGAEICSIDQQEPQNFIEAVGRWFADWGEIFGAIPDKFRSWDVESFALHGFPTHKFEGNPTAIDILDPGCVVCLQSYKNQQNSNFFNQHNTLIVPFAIENPDGTYKFKNSGIIVRYLLASAEYNSVIPNFILNSIFTTFNENHVIYQTVFNDLVDEAGAEQILQSWLATTNYFFLSASEIAEIITLAHSNQITAKMAHNKDIITNDINVRGIPTIIFNGRRHTGLFRGDN